MKRIILLLSLVGAILLSTSTVFATDRLVPSEYPTIQAAINAAVNGDRVIIAQGTYTGPDNRELDFGGRAISVQSEDPNNWDVVAATIIDCQYGGRGFHFHSGETASSVLAGLTITKGYTDHGGGVYCEGSSPTIRNCNLTDNIADYGGGMGNQNCSPTITNCMFAGNGVFYYGGGMYNSGCTLAVSNCIFAGNSADWGGGIENSNCPGTIVNCTFTGNSADVGGGMDNISSSGLTVSNCILWGDSASTGPEIYGSISVSYCDVQGTYGGEGNIDSNPCFAGAAGGDYHLLQGSPCIDAGTNSPAGGLPHTDIEGNPRPLDGDANGVALADMGAYELNLGEPVIALSAPEFNFMAPESGPNPDNQILSVSNGGLGTLNWQIAENCAWLEAEPNSGSSMGQTNEVTLSVDATGLGSGQYICELIVYDPCALNSPQTVDVNLVITGPMIELSAETFEFYALEGGPDPQEQILTIRNSGGGTLYWEILEDCEWLMVDPNTGSSAGELDEVTLSVNISGLTGGEYNCELTVFDSNAENSPQTVWASVIIHVPGEDLLVPSQYPTLQLAIDAAVDGDIVIVADGIYTGPGNRRINFGGRAITLCSEGGPENCIIDCEYLGRGFIFNSGEGENSVVIGFTITHGMLWCDPCGCPITWLGGGIYCTYSSPTIRECIIRDNYAHSGGGISIEDGAPKVINCVITNNEAMDGGGGIYCGSGDVSVVNCTIVENLAGDYGGGLFCTDEATVVSSILWGNTPDQIEDLGLGSVTAFLNDIEGGWSGGINVDPCFANPVNRDYHLKSEAGRWDPNENRWVADTNTSPCLDFGYDGFYPGLDYKSELWPHGKWINMGAYGGTPQASMSLSDVGNIADLDNDDDVDYADMGVFVDEWLSQEVLLSEDLNRNGFVDFNDFGIFAGNWLWEE